jgi:hypothetical protein
MGSYGFGQIVGPLIFGFLLGLAIDGIRARKERRRATAAGETVVPPRQGPWPTIGVCVAVFYALTLVGGMSEQAGASADRALQSAVKDSALFQRDVWALAGKPAGTSYAPLDASLPKVRALETQGRELRATMQGLDRSAYDRDELALVDAVVALESADLAFIAEWQRVITGRRLHFTVAGATLPPAEFRKFNGTINAIRRAAMNGLAPAVALGSISQADADKARKQFEAQIAEASKEHCTC